MADGTEPEDNGKHPDLAVALSPGVDPATASEQEIPKAELGLELQIVARLLGLTAAVANLLWSTTAVAAKAVGGMGDPPVALKEMSKLGLLLLLPGMLAVAALADGASAAASKLLGMA